LAMLLFGFMRRSFPNPERAGRPSAEAAAAGRNIRLQAACIAQLVKAFLGKSG
jgi:hypothetical protein